MVTVRRWLSDCSLPLTEKRALLCSLTGMTQIQAITEGDRELPDELVSKLNELARRRQDGVPTPYLTGRQEFFSRDFKVDESVLIPRPDTECLVEWAIENIPQNALAVDLGTGSGCIAVTVKLERPDCSMWATDLSEKALAVARQNAEQLGAAIEFSQGSWLDALPENVSPEVILSNPPYIDPQDGHLKNLSCEPRSALTDEIDGLSCIREILRGCESHRTILKIIAIEHGWDQGAAVREIFKNYGFVMAETHRDYGGNDRFTTWKSAYR